MLRRDDDSVLRDALDLEARATEEDLEEASGGGDGEDWFEEGGCPESSKWRDEVQAIAEGMGRV